MGIEYIKLNLNDITDDLLIGFNRYQVTERVKYLNKGILEEKEDYFIENWDTSKLTDLTKSFRRILEEGGSVIIARDRKKVIGFVSLASDMFFDEYLNLDIIQVSNEYRRQGIGKKLFELISIEAKKLGAKKLYISSHPNINTQKFYTNMGCVLAKKINQHLYDLEPLDIQLEKTL